MERLQAGGRGAQAGPEACPQLPETWHDHDRNLVRLLLSSVAREAAVLELDEKIWISC